MSRNERNRPRAGSAVRTSPARAAARRTPERDPRPPPDRARGAAGSCRAAASRSDTAPPAPRAPGCRSRHRRAPTSVHFVVTNRPPAGSAHITSTCSKARRKSSASLGRGACRAESAVDRSAVTASGRTACASSYPGCGRDDLFEAEHDVSAEWVVAGQHLVGDHAQRPDVPRGTHHVAGGLLRRHVFERADQHPGVGPFRAIVRPPGAKRLGQPEVEHLGEDAVVVRLKEDVLGLQVAVHQSLRVGGADRRAHAAEDVEHLGAVQRRPWRQPLPQRLPFEQLHDQKCPALAIDAEIVDADDVRMREARGRAGLVAEAGVEIDRADQVVADQLHRHWSFERFVDSRVHRAHPASSQPAVETVAPVQHTRAAHGRQTLAVVRADAGRAVEAPPAALALGQPRRRRVSRRPVHQQPQRMRDRSQQIEILLVVRLLRPARAQHQQRDGPACRYLADDRHQQLDAAHCEQRAFLALAADGAPRRCRRATAPAAGRGPTAGR